MNYELWLGSIGKALRASFLGAHTNNLGVLFQDRGEAHLDWEGGLYGQPCK